MKVRIDIECSPEEARSFLGLPDVAPMQAELLDAARERMKASVEALDPEALLRMWMPAGLAGLEGLQKQFWSHLTGKGGPGGAARDDEPKGR